MIQDVLNQQILKNQIQESNSIEFIQQMIAIVRPKNAHDTAEATYALQALCFSLSQQAEYAKVLREAILDLLIEKNAISLYSDLGIQSTVGFFSELFRRISHKVLPEAKDTKYLKDIFGTLFSHSDDHIWISNIPNQVWCDLLTALQFNAADELPKITAQQEVKDALQVLSYRLSASGLDPELIKNHEDLENYDSPFITQNIEVVKYLSLTTSSDENIKPIEVMLSQCLAVVARVRKNNAQTGTSIQVTALLQRIQQQIRRMQTLLQILHGFHIKTDVNPTIISLFVELVYAECHKNNLGHHLRENTELMALRVTENASHTGEHYIANNRSEYFALMKSAMGAGLIITMMAFIKISISALHLAPLTEAILFSLNYGIGFVVIHILHFTVATKQPAMTAATIASTIGASDSNIKSLDKLIQIISQTISSQTIAILGNIVVVIPMAMAVDQAILWCTGHHFIGPDKANQLLTSNNPLQSGAVVYAAMAGVCLFLAGLIAGYHDNLSAYNRIPERIASLAWLKKLIGAKALHKTAQYIRTDLGALAGNFYFGCLLGGLSGLGVLLGLPLDIRHVTFVAAFFGYSASALDFQLTHYVLGTAILGIVLVATANLLTSFFLAIYVAMKSRKVRFEHWRLFIKSLLSQLNQHPGQFFLPPKQ